MKQQPAAPAIVIYWAGRKFVFKTAAEALAAGFHLDTDEPPAATADDKRPL